MNAEQRARVLRLSVAILFPSFGVALTSASGRDDGERPHLVVMANGDRLQGMVTGFSADQGLSMSYPDALDPVRLKLNSVRSMVAAASATQDSPEAKAVITFTNGDTVPADIQSFDGKKLRIATPLAGGSHDFQWATVERIAFTDDLTKRLFQGPMVSQDWKFTGRRNQDGAEGSGTANWRLDKNEILADNPGSASINAQLPDQVTVEFEMEWTGQMNFSVALFSDAFLPASEDEPKGPTVVENAGKQGETIPLREGIALDLNPHNIILRTHSGEQGQDMIGSSQMPQEFRSRTTARMIIRADRAAGTFAVWREGKLLSKWKDIGEIPGKGKGISFWQHHNNGTLSIRRLIVKNWNGKLEEAVPRIESDKDVLIATDGSRLTGEIKGLKEDRWSISGQIGDLDFARDDVRHIVRASEEKPAKNEKEKSAASDQSATVTLLGGHVFHLEEIALDPSGKITGRHAILGSLEFPFTNVEAIQFPKPATEKP